MASANQNNPQNLGPKIGTQVHPLYQLMKPTWEKLAHVREGTGGFLSEGNDSYIVAHPREWLDHTSTTTDADGVKTTRLNSNPRSASPKLKARRKLARYENIAAAILESKKSVLFREQPTRLIGKERPKPGTPPKDLQAWWADVDGDGLNIDDAMPLWWDIAATFGHCVLYMDVGGTIDTSATAADQAQPYLRVYTPFDVLDWRHDENGTLVWIKLLEAVQGVSTAQTQGVTTYRVRIVDEVSWQLYDYKGGAFIDQGDHGFGIVPVAYLFGKRRSLLADIGESILGDPRNFIDLFNLASELRELLRNQTFSFINLPLGTGPDAMSVEQAQTMMGQQTGTMNVLFSGGAASILTGDAANVTAYQDEISRLERRIYRQAGVPWESDTKGVEAAGSLELKREELAIRVAAYADECQETEYALADLYYRARYGADAGPAKLEADEVQIHYSERFAQTPFKEVLDQAAAAQSLGMPPLFLKELRKALITKFDGMANLDPATLDAITQAIDAAADDPTPAERMQQKMKLAEAAVKGGGKPPAGDFAAASGAAA